MNVIYGSDVNDVYPIAITLLKATGVKETSRAGEVLVSPVPVTSHYKNPANRVLLDPIRDANPFFHLMEALWILAGREDVAWLAQFNKRMAEFSDNGVTFHAPYGARLRRWPDRTREYEYVDRIDQVERAITMLTKDPGSRRVVLSIWDPVLDLGTDSKDIPCNDLIKLEIRDGKLNLMVFCRSNDIVWGCYGANVVQFSVLQEYLAARIGVGIGWMEQVSANWHAYTAIWDEMVKNHHLAPNPESPYDRGEVARLNLVGNAALFDKELREFMTWTTTPDWDETDPGDFKNTFLSVVAVPMFTAWKAYKAGLKAGALTVLEDTMAVCDWQVAALAWIKRRMVK